jgi:glycine oxidase
MPAEGGIGTLTHQPSPDAVVVGGGVIGLGIAWRAALAGMAVTVVDEAPGRGASWAAAGMLAPVTEVHYGERPLLSLNLAAAARWPAFAAEVEEASGLPVGYRPGGTLAVARDADDNAALEDLYQFQLRCGLEVERLRSRECRQLEPGLAPSIRGGIPPPATTRSTTAPWSEPSLVACQRAGVRMVRAGSPSWRSRPTGSPGAPRRRWARPFPGRRGDPRRRGGGGRRVLERGSVGWPLRCCRRCGR